MDTKHDEAHSFQLKEMTCFETAYFQINQLKSIKIPIIGISPLVVNNWPRVAGRNYIDTYTQDKELFLDVFRHKPLIKRFTSNLI